ncbi:MAG: toprim domain-containing protein [Patescibacteria group bacterium]
MDNTQRLIELFKEFPGIGPRQAKRFVYFLLNRNQGYSADLSRLISEVRSTVHACDTCFRFFPNGTNKTCSICRDDTRENTLMLVSQDVDFENIEKTKFYKGYYFVLGGSIPILEKNPEKRIRQKELTQTLQDKIKNGLTEVILALNYNPEGENTLTYLKETIEREFPTLKISTLGRGLSTGTELEYSDSDTIKNALKNRQ